MKIEVGKYYRRRDGQKVGPMARSGCNNFPWHQSGLYMTFKDNGRRFDCQEHPTDLIAEWTEAPTSHVRTVTRKEIVPGVYGNVIVWNDGSGDVSVMNMRTATELRAAVATLTEIADALEGGAV